MDQREGDPYGQQATRSSLRTTLQFALAHRCDSCKFLSMRHKQVYGQTLNPDTPCFFCLPIYNSTPHTPPTSAPLPMGARNSSLEGDVTRLNRDLEDHLDDYKLFRAKME